MTCTLFRPEILLKLNIITNMKQGLVSLITVNYNQSLVTRDLLLSLRKVTYPAIEIIVVDNGSPSDTPEILKVEFPEIVLIESKENLGFAGGNNLGLNVANGEFCLFINNDTEVEPDFLEPLVERFKSNPEIGMMSPKIKFHHTPDTIQYAGYSPINQITLRQHLIGYCQVDKGQFDEGGFTFAAHGAAMMVPAKVIDQVGPMDEVFFLYYEEHDWCERIKKAGYKVYFEPASVVWHKESLSTGKESPLKIYYIARNRILYARRNIKGLKKVASVSYLFTVVPLVFTVRYLLKGNIKLLKAAAAGTIWNIWN